MRISDWSSDVCSSDLSIAGQFALGRLIRRLQCFGFHLATLDLRQDSAIHDAALAALLQQPDYAEREPAERAPTLHSLIAGAPVAVPDAEAAAPVLAVFAALAQARPRSGAQALGAYIDSLSPRADRTSVV